MGDMVANRAKKSAGRHRLGEQTAEESHMMIYPEVSTSARSAQVFYVLASCGALR